MQRMKTLGIVLALSLLVVPITPVLARKDPSTIHYGCLGMTMGTFMGQTFMIEAINIERSPIGPYDFMVMMMGVEMYAYTDNLAMVPIFEELMENMGMPDIEVVDDEELEVCQRGKRVIVELNTGPYTGLSVEFKGISGAEKGVESFTNPTNGWMMEAKFIGFYAFVNVLIFEYIGVGQVATQMRMTITEPAS